ncbi:hypothetical protein AVEN_182017-1 [Araneus ventricosus]|uniref:Uncharacterized protein n=1 Tax=Araneus ventricosus TaxID=182803 RepID=A0A4Y2TTQ9_ARAVE|nr:hypothetical protein AVEN_182017-1 [Araneus ventricosus]
MWSSCLNCRAVSEFGFNRLKKGFQIAYSVSSPLYDAKKVATAGAFSPPVLENGACYYRLAPFSPPALGRMRESVGETTSTSLVCVQRQTDRRNSTKCVFRTQEGLKRGG